MKYKYNVGDIVPFGCIAITHLGYPVGTKFKCISSTYHAYTVGKTYELEENTDEDYKNLRPVSIKDCNGNGYSASWEVLYIPGDTTGLPLFDYADGVR